MVSTFLRKVSFADPHIFAGAKFQRLKALKLLIFLVGSEFRRNFAYAKQLCCPCSSGSFQHFAYAKPASLSALLCCAFLRIKVGKLSTAKMGGQPLVAGVCFSKLTDKLFPKLFRKIKIIKRNVVK